MKIEENVPLGRLTTVGIGGPAHHFARPGTLAELEEALAWAAERGVDVFTIGLGSNLLIADDGVDALVLRLEGELAEGHAGDGLLIAGGEPRTRSASIAPVRRGSAASSSHARSPGRSAEACR